MNYRTKNKIGTYIEIASIVGLTASIEYRLPFIVTLASAIIFGYGDNLRESALEEAKNEGIAEGIRIERGLRISRNDLSDVADSGGDLPFIP